MTPLCVALIRVGLALLGQEGASCGPQGCPVPRGVYSVAPAPAATSTWTAVGGLPAPMPSGPYYYPSPCSAAVPACPPCVPVSQGYAVVQPPVPPSPHPDAVLVGELIQVLNETRSKETFCLTVKLLVLLKGERKHAIPAVIRNAERLKICRGMLKDQGKWTGEQEVLAASLEALIDSPGEIRPAATGARRTPAPPPARSSLLPWNWNGNAWPPTISY